MTHIMAFGQIVESNGRTIRQNNMDRSHNIPVGTLVEVKWDEWHGDGACEKIHARLWVTHHDRDCDGSPLYRLGTGRLGRFRSGGFAEDNLTPVAVTDELKYGEGALDWDDAEAVTT